MKIGLITDCLKTNLETALYTAQRLGFDGVQIYATTGEFSPSALSEKDIARYKSILSKTHLVVSALCGDMGGYGFEIEKDNAERIEKTKKIIDLASEFNTNVVSTHIGVIPSDKSEKRYKVMLSALTECGIYAKSKGITLAIETGAEDAVTLKAFIEDTKGGVGVNFDPANFVMVTGQEPIAAIELLKEHIAHVHIKDGKMLRKVSPKIIYDSFAKGGIDALNASDYFIETPVGEGDVDFIKLFNKFNEIKYDGFYTIERETGDKPEEDIIKALNYIKKIKIER